MMHGAGGADVIGAGTPAAVVCGPGISGGGTSGPRYRLYMI